MDSEIKKTQRKLLSEELSCEELVQEKFSLLESGRYNTGNSFLKEMAVEMARKVDANIKKGEQFKPLEGVPFGVKDAFLLEGSFATASSDMLKRYRSPYTATALRKLIDAGAIPIVKENCDCFGHGSTSENTVFGPVENAWVPGHVAGGSSGGSAVNVAMDYTVFSIGADTGGSIRQPAGFNRVYGMKPTYGRVSRFGLMAYASSTDCVGPISKSIEDIRTLLNIMGGKDFRDSTTIVTDPVRDDLFELPLSPREIRIGFYRSFIESDKLDSRIKNDFLDLIDTLKTEKFKITELDFFEGNTLVSAYYTISLAETASNLARLDGTNYGARNNHRSLKEGYALSRSENFTDETKRRIAGGNQVLSQGYSEEIYTKAKKLRGRISAKFDDDFDEVDIILSPVSPITPPEIGTSLEDPLSMYLSDAYTVGFSLGGLPTLSAPFGPETGVQITAAKKREDIILKVAHYIRELQ